MKCRILYFAIGAALLAHVTMAEEANHPNVRLAVFHSHLSKMAEERGVPLAEVVKTVRSWGIEGIDVFSAVDHGEASRMLDLGMSCAAYIVSADFARTNDTVELDKAIATAKERKASLIMLVPGQVPPAMTRETAWQIAKPRIAAFLERAAKADLVVALEDFDWGEPIVGSAEHLRRAFRELPALQHVFDTGNYLRWNEDPLVAQRDFQDRICHVHAKALGGRVPLEEIVHTLKSNSYRGWLTIECFDATNMWTAVEASARNIKKWMKQ